MRKILLGVLLLIPVGAFAQSFEGTLVYKADFQVSEKMKKMGMTKEKLQEKMLADGGWSDTIQVMYRQGNYRTQFSSTPKSWMIYKADTNKIYSFQEGEGAGICTVTDASVDYEETLTGKMPVVKKLDTIAKLNGRSCEVITVQWKSGTYSYYYEKGYLKVDPRLFKGHVYDGWSAFIQQSEALPVRIVKELAGLSTVTLDLVSAIPDIPSQSLYNIPKLKTDPDLNILNFGNREVMRIQ